MAFVSFFWAGKKPKDPADKNLKSAIPTWRMPFSEPPFQSLPVTEHLSSTAQKSLALPFLPRWIILALFLVLQRLALVTHPSLPSICVLSSGGGWCDSPAPKQSSCQWVQGATARHSGPTPVPPSPHSVWSRASCTPREAAWEAVWA